MYKALRSFSGLVCMAEGEIKEIPDKAIAQDLLNCGYIEAVGETPAVEEPKPRKKRAPKGA